MTSEEQKIWIQHFKIYNPANFYVVSRWVLRNNTFLVSVTRPMKSNAELIKLGDHCGRIKGYFNPVGDN